MRLSCLLLLCVISIGGCSKKDDVPRTNFAELTVAGNKFKFDKIEVIIDTSTYATNTEIRFEDSGTNSHLNAQTSVGGRRMIKIYRNPGEPFPGPSLQSLFLNTYVDGVPSSYFATANSLKIHIDKVENGRMHGLISGKVTCYCYTNGVNEEAEINGEFELAYIYN